MEIIDKMLKEWESLQPLKNEDQKRLDDKFKLEFNYNSNHIEGNTLTYGQTKLLLMFDDPAGNASFKAYQEMKAHNVGLEMIKQYALEKELPLTETFIRELNHTILVQNYWKDTKTPDGQPTKTEVKVGEYKTHPNSVKTVTGETFEYAMPEQTPALMADLVCWFNDEVKKGELNPIELATLLHYRYIRIHPFDDGNGRIARLLVNYVMLKYDYPMIVIKTEDKPNYVRVLHRCDVKSGLSPFEGANATLEEAQVFVEYMKRQLEYALDICIRAAKGERIEEKDDFAKKLELIKNSAKQKTELQENKIKFSSDEVWNVLEFCFFPIEKELRIALEPTTKLFSFMQSYNLISKTESPKGGLHLNDVLHRRWHNPQVNDFVSNAKNMFFVYELRHVKREIFEDDTFRIEEKFSISFEKDHYIINLPDEEKIRYDYQKYPSSAQIDSIVSIYKNRVLKQIEAASKK